MQKQKSRKEVLSLAAMKHAVGGKEAEPCWPKKPKPEEEFIECHRENPFKGKSS